ncbi:MAG: hypothetical protein HYX27_23420 [Acidobacteria bacterium]|nr:hypothetical protein [Acidobacteriota bacterium]
MKRILLILLGACALFAEDTSRVVQLKYINPDSTAAVLDILAAGRVRWRTDGNLRIIALSGPSDLVEAMDAAVKKLDVPASGPKNLEVIFHIITANSQPGANSVSPDLNAVVQQLGTVFGLKSFRVLESAVMRGREGRSIESSGIIAIPVKGDGTPEYHIKCQRLTTSSSDKGLQIRMDNLEFRIMLPIANADGKGFSYRNASIHTDVDVREGQKVVVGKSSLDTSGQSVFLVVSAKAID